MPASSEKLKVVSRCSPSRGRYFRRRCFAMKTVSHLRSVSERATSGDFDDQQRLSDLIGVVYDAAIDPIALGGRHRKGRRASSAAPAAGFSARTSALRMRRSRTAFGFQMPLPVALFQQIYPAAEGHFLGDLEQPIATTDLMSFGELAESELYRQWAEPQGLVDFLSAVVDRDDDQRGDIRRVSPRTKRRRRRPGAPAHEADRAAYQAGGA